MFKTDKRTKFYEELEVLTQDFEKSVFAIYKDSLSSFEKQKKITRHEQKYRENIARIARKYKRGKPVRFYP